MAHENLKPGVDVREATHVKAGGRTERIVSKWGIRPEGGFEGGGFGVVTESGRHVDMRQAQLFFKEE